MIAGRTASDPPRRDVARRRINWALIQAPVLMQPNGVRIPGDEFLDRQIVNDGRTRNSLLLPLDKDGHEFLLSLAPRSLFGSGSFASWTGHFAFLLRVRHRMQ